MEAITQGIGSTADFAASAEKVLQFLQARLGFDLWVLSRVQGEDYIVLQAQDRGYGMKPGDVFNYADTFCKRMIAGQGPQVAPQSPAVPSYAAAAMKQGMTIGSYIGVPISHSDGSLFGTLCAIHPNEQPASIVSEQPLVELLASLLGSLLNAELKVAEAERRAERARAEALSDGLTGLYNRRGWDQLLRAEEDRCRRYGHSACVICVDLDGLKRINDTVGHAAGDELISRAGSALHSQARRQDIVARLGGDEFAILAVECDRVAAQLLVHRLRAALGASGVAASIGYAMREPAQGLQVAQQQADEAMYAEKSRRRSK